MEVHRVIGSAGELEAGNEASICVLLEGPVVGRVVRGLSAVFGAPGGAPVTVAVSVVELIVSTAGHVVEHGIGVDSNSMGAASIDQAAELVTRATTTIEVVGDGLIVPIPGVDLAVLHPDVGHHGLLSREDFDTHPATLG